MRNPFVTASIISTLLILVACGKKYLDTPPLGQLDEKSVTNKRGVEMLLIGAYSLLDGVRGEQSINDGYYSSASNWIFGSVAGTEAYTGSEFSDPARISIVPCEKFSHTATNDVIAARWAVLYDGIQRTNVVLRLVHKISDISAADRRRIRGEARFLRAHYHFEAKKIWNHVPFVDETITYESGNYHLSNQNNIWPDIENDLRFAVDSLPETPYQGAVGRATRYTAMALLAKVYLFQKKYDPARALLNQIINSGKFALVNYHDNFDPGNIDSAETVFSVQMSVNDGANGLNGNFGDVLNYPFVPGQGDCCGFFNPSESFVNHFKTDSITGLPDFNYNVNPIPSDQGIESADPFTPYQGTLDPRLDWTVGRRGIPYLDWGIHPGKSWIRNQELDGPYSPKKNAYNKDQQNQLTDASFWGGFGRTSTNNINLIRYADVLLWAAEVETEIGDLNKARDYVNQVRRRAANPVGWVHTYVDNNNPSLGFTNTPAANYKIGEYKDPWTDRNFARKAVRYERLLELGMEGHRFFDLVRWGIADSEINGYIQYEKQQRTYLAGSQFTANKNEYFAIPQLQIDLSAGPDGKRMMTQNPGY